MADKKVNEYYTRPPVLTKWEGFKQFMWNPETNQFLGRTGASWGKLGIGYFIFYCGLALMVTICMWLFFLTIDPKYPKWQLDRSLIGDSPGLGFRPMDEENAQSSLIWYQWSNKTSYTYWADQLTHFLDKYYVPKKIPDCSISYKPCTYYDYPILGEEICKIEVKDWMDCNKDQFFSYHRKAPCVFLKLNKIYGWSPKYYDDPLDLPKEMPEQLKQHISSINNTIERKNVWISCEGEHPIDVENIGHVKYYPKHHQGFPGFYFPYINTEGYLNPLVAIKFENPTPGIVINVECRAWAKNIKYNRADRIGSIHFELLVD